MSFFGNDDFFGGGIDELFNRLASEGALEYSDSDSSGKRRVIRRGKRNVFGKIFLNKIITSKRVYLIFDLSDKKDISARLKDETIENRQGKRVLTGNKLLEVDEGAETIFEFLLEDISTAGFEYTFNNGILEVSFKK